MVFYPGGGGVAGEGESGSAATASPTDASGMGGFEAAGMQSEPSRFLFKGSQLWGEALRS